MADSRERPASAETFADLVELLNLRAADASQMQAEQSGSSKDEPTED